jgi:hypothetical protein
MSSMWLTPLCQHYRLTLLCVLCGYFFLALCESLRSFTSALSEAHPFSPSSLVRWFCAIAWFFDVLYVANSSCASTIA